MFVRIKEAISKYDLFMASPVLRVKGESGVTNSYGGLFSILLLGFFIYIFLNNIIATINLQTITSTQTV